MINLDAISARRSIPSIYLIGLTVLFVLVVLFTAITIYIEYLNFGKETERLRSEYIKEQKEQIHFDTSRVLRFIAQTYEEQHDRIEEQALQNQIIRSIERLYGRRDGTGYIFVYDFNGTCLSDPVQRYNVGKNLYRFRDPDGVQVIRKLIDVSRRPGGGFVRYTWIKPTSRTPSPKISYARAFEPWKWMVGTGVYLDEVEKVIAGKREALRQKTLGTVGKILALMAVLAFIGLLGVRILNRIIRREIERLNRHFELAAKRHLLIDRERVRLSEFLPMVDSINTMVSEIHRRKNKLREVNLSLEHKVAEKTANLKEHNRLLREEKALSEALIRAQDSFIRQSIHEINTPLAVIMNHIDIYKMKMGENRYLAKIEAAAKMIATIYDDLSYMVKRNRFEYEKSTLDFSDFLRERIRFFREIAQGNRLEIREHIEEGISLFFSDVELQRIIDNNLSNAIKYARDHTAVTVILRRRGEETLLEFHSCSRQPISDTRRIFDAFHREDDKVKGFGLGLEIVRSICEKNDVKVAVSSDHDLTVFRYYFSMKEADHAHTAA